jgi:hypothetical protein
MTALETYDKHDFTCVFARDCFFWHYANWSDLASVLQSVQTPLTTATTRTAKSSTKLDALRRKTNTSWEVEQ